jgi:hypothetical protein
MVAVALFLTSFSQDSTQAKMALISSIYGNTYSPQESSQHFLTCSLDGIEAMHKLWQAIFNANRSRVSTLLIFLLRHIFPCGNVRQRGASAMTLHNERHAKKRESSLPT